MHKVEGSFLFGVEAELILVDIATKAPLWQADLDYAQLQDLVESINYSDLQGDYSLLEEIPPAHYFGPYHVEGYNIFDDHGSHWRYEAAPGSVVVPGRRLHLPPARLGLRQRRAAG